jgi:tetratricopeptide (TPR) repeat protein
LQRRARAIQFLTSRRQRSRNRYAITRKNAFETLFADVRGTAFFTQEAKIMKRFITLAMLLALVVGAGALPMLAQQTGTVKGTTKDLEGKPITDATVDFENTESGRKISLKLNPKGEYFSVGIPAGTYNIRLMKNGQPIDGFNKVPITPGVEQSINFDLKKDNVSAGPSAEELKKYEEAKANNEKIKGLNASLQQARDLEKAGNNDQAIALLKPLAEQNPDKDLLWASLGDAYRSAKQWPEAIEAYQKAVQLNPKSGGYHNGLAEAYAKSGQVDKALAEYNAAAQAEPANAAMYYFNEGAVLTNTGKVDDALTAFDKVIAADPSRAEAYYWKGVNLMAKATTGKDGKFVAVPGTAEAFQKYLELKPDGPMAQPAKDMLASIGASVETSYGKGKTAKSSPKK